MGAWCLGNTASPAGQVLLWPPAGTGSSGLFGFEGAISLSSGTKRLFRGTIPLLVTFYQNNLNIFN